jgi:hypothetical protein
MHLRRSSVCALRAHGAEARCRRCGLRHDGLAREDRNRMSASGPTAESLGGQSATRRESTQTTPPVESPGARPFASNAARELIERRRLMKNPSEASISPKSFECAALWSPTQHAISCECRRIVFAMASRRRRPVLICGTRAAASASQSLRSRRDRASSSAHASSVS